MMDTINFTSAKYAKNLNDENSCIVATVEGKVGNLIIPLADDNTHYEAILAWVADGNTIEEAD